MKTFEELGLVPDLIRAIDEIGYESPMPIQEAVIPYLLGEGNDVIALAQTGTGKTAAYGLPLLQKIDPSREGVQAVVLSPTRELCLQIAGDLKDYSKYLDGVRVLAVYGGADISSQIRALRRGVHSFSLRYFDTNGGVLEAGIIDSEGRRIPFSSRMLKH